MKLPKVYEPELYENDIYALWEKSGAFLPKARGSRETYSLVIPPPNANGDLHIGHVLTLVIEDIIVRYQRMRGKATLFLPGADHAGFETQSVYEKQLAKAGKSRFDFSREELYAQIWDFVAQNRDNYESQFRQVGASLDWTRFTFTLDDKSVKRAYDTFKKMWDEGLIYRGERLVNYCTFHGTSFADIEVVYKQIEGHLWYISYPLTDGSGVITVATTRPETMLGDTAVAVHPRDKRYKQFIGRTVKLPLTEREVPVIADELVDQSFGTGAVKITPAHDPNDYEASQRHDLPMVTVIGYDGRMTHDVPEPYRGLSVDEARQAVVANLKAAGRLQRSEKYTHNIGHCYKCGTVIQPLLREQWFVDMQPLAKKAIQVLRAGKISFYPESKKDQLIEYLKGLKDWNISRQIAWGIPIPAFQSLDNPKEWIFDERIGQEIIEVNGKRYKRDPDVFDTWFSSSSWPYATLDYPDSEDYKRFYPLSLMETGGEILYPWVSRMIMLGLYVTGNIPFKEVYIHGYVLAEDGTKMSKSLGNVVDPFPVIKQYGSDALRMGIIAGRAPAVNRGYDPRRVEEARNFANKLWNVARFIEEKLGDGYHSNRAPKAKTVADAWILNKLQQSIREISQYLDRYRLSEAYELVYHLLWDDFADWYVEASKVELNKEVLAHGLEIILKLAHPFAPFVTETVWQTLAWQQDTNLITADWPQPHKTDAKKSRAFEQVRHIVTEIRHIKSTMNLQAGLSLYHSGDELLREHGGLIKSLAKLDSVKQVRAGRGLHLTNTDVQAWLDIDQETARHFLVKLEEKRTATEAHIKQLEKRLSNARYVKKAPKHLVQETKDQLAEARRALGKMEQEHERFAAVS